MLPPLPWKDLLWSAFESRHWVSFQFRPCHEFGRHCTMSCSLYNIQNVSDSNSVQETSVYVTLSNINLHNVFVLSSCYALTAHACNAESCFGLHGTVLRRCMQHASCQIKSHHRPPRTLAVHGETFHDADSNNAPGCCDVCCMLLVLDNPAMVCRRHRRQLQGQHQTCSKCIVACMAKVSQRAYATVKMLLYAFVCFVHLELSNPPGGFRDIFREYLLKCNSTHACIYSIDGASTGSMRLFGLLAWSREPL